MYGNNNRVQVKAVLPCLMFNANASVVVYDSPLKTFDNMTKQDIFNFFADFEVLNIQAICGRFHFVLRGGN